MLTWNRSPASLQPEAEFNYALLSNQGQIGVFYILVARCQIATKSARVRP
jgi:hypothetical protein